MDEFDAMVNVDVELELLAPRLVKLASAVNPNVCANNEFLEKKKLTVILTLVKLIALATAANSKIAVGENANEINPLVGVVVGAVLPAGTGAFTVVNVNQESPNDVYVAGVVALMIPWFKISTPLFTKVELMSFTKLV